MEKDMQNVDMKKKGLRITAKILLILLIPLLAVSAISSLLGAYNEREMAFQLYEEELKGIAENARLLYELDIPGDFSYEGDVLKKGDTVISDNTEIIDAL